MKNPKPIPPKNWMISIILRFILLHARKKNYHQYRKEKKDLIFSRTIIFISILQWGERANGNNTKTDAIYINTFYGKFIFYYFLYNFPYYIKWKWRKKNGKSDFGFLFYLIFFLVLYSNGIFRRSINHSAEDSGFSLGLSYWKI